MAINLLEALLALWDNERKNYQQKLDVEKGTQTSFLGGLQSLGEANKTPGIMQSGKRDQYFQGVQQIAQSGKTPDEKINDLVGLTAQHGSDYGLGVKDIIEQYGRQASRSASNKPFSINTGVEAPAGMEPTGYDQKGNPILRRIEEPAPAGREESFGINNGLNIPDDMEITGYDQKTGNPIIRKKKTDKPSAAAEKRQVEEGKLSDELGGLLKSFERAKAEGQKNIPGFGKAGLSGRIAGAGAKISGKTGYLPAINVYNAQRNAFATVVAKAAGEVRPTDEDIRRFVETLPSTEKSDAENELLIADINSKVSGGDIGSLWKSSKAGSKTQTPQVGQVFNGQKVLKVRRVR